MRIIEELKNIGFEEVDKKITPMTLINTKCTIAFNDYVIIKYSGGTHMIEDFEKVIPFLKQEKLI